MHARLALGIYIDSFVGSGRLTRSAGCGEMQNLTLLEVSEYTYTGGSWKTPAYGDETGMIKIMKVNVFCVHYTRVLLASEALDTH